MVIFCIVIIGVPEICFEIWKTCSFICPHPTYLATSTEVTPHRVVLNIITEPILVLRVRKPFPRKQGGGGCSCPFSWLFNNYSFYFFGNNLSCSTLLTDFAIRTKRNFRKMGIGTKTQQMSLIDFTFKMQAIAIERPMQLNTYDML